MKRTSNSTLLCFCLAVAGLATNPVYAGSYLYNYQTPLISVTTGLQMGRSASIRGVQTSATNVFAVTQIGQSLSASVFQYGIHNIANVVQITPASPFIGY